jgi:hypothetical protein
MVVFPFGLPFCLHCCGLDYNIILNLPILFIVGDTEGHDRLCGRYKRCAHGVAHLCRHCTTPTLQTSNLDVDADDHDGLQTISQHYVQNAFYDGICLGGHPHGIHGITPPGKLLHVVDLGNFKGATQGFMENLASTSVIMSL